MAEHHEQSSQAGDLTPLPRETPALGKVIGILDKLYPRRWKEDWDAVGLVCGDPAEPVNKVLFAVDPVADVVDEAIETGADLLVVHHPLLLRGVHSVAADSHKGSVVHRLIRAGCALYCAHTNADIAAPGVSDALGRVLGLQNLHPLRPAAADPLDMLTVYVPLDDAQPVLSALAEAGAGQLGEYERCAWFTDGTGTFLPGEAARPAIGTAGEVSVVPETRLDMVVPPGRLEEVLRAMRNAHPYEEPAFHVSRASDQDGPRGLGRVGELTVPMTLERFATEVARALPHTVQGIRVSGPAEALVHRVAVCGGSGDSLFDDVRASGADVYVTADLRHHPASEAREHAGGERPYLVDVAHFASEWPWLHGCAARLVDLLWQQGAAVDTAVSTRCTDPWTFRVPSSGGIVR